MQLFQPKFSASYVCAPGAAMLEKLDLLQEDQNGFVDLLNHYLYQPLAGKNDYVS